MHWLQFVTLIAILITVTCWKFGSRPVLLENVTALLAAAVLFVGLQVPPRGLLGLTTITSLFYAICWMAPLGGYRRTE